MEATREILIAAEELDDQDPESPSGGANPLLDDSSDEGGSFGTHGSSKSVPGDEREHEQERGQGQGQGQGQGRETAAAPAEASNIAEGDDIGEDLLAGSLRAMRVSGVDMTRVNDAISEMTREETRQQQQQ